MKEKWLEDRAEFFLNLSYMQKDGFSLAQTFLILEEETSLKEKKMFYERVRQKLAQGFSLAEALAVEKGFSQMILMAISAAEKAGRLEDILEKLAMYDQQELKVKEQLKTMLIYPMFVVILLISVLIYMAVVVIPALEVFLPQTSKENILTKSLFLLSAFLYENGIGLFIFFGVSVGLIVIIKFIYREMFDEYIDDFWNHVPILGKLKKEFSLSIAFFILAILKQSGVPLDQAIREIVYTTRGDFKKAFEGCLLSLSGGMTFSQAIKEEIYFPSFISGMLSVAEKFDQQEAYLYKIYETLQRTLTHSIKMLMGMIQPVLLLSCACFIVIVVLGFLAPIYSNLVGMSMGIIK